MSRNLSPRHIARMAGIGALVIAGATGIAVLIAQILLQPPRRDLTDLALYLASSGAVTVVLGWLAIRALERIVRPLMLVRFLAVTLVASAVLIVNIVVLAQLMFISTDHDLQVLLATVAFSTIIAVSFATWIASGTIARISEINDGIRALAAGELGQAIGVADDDELARLAADVNTLSARLARAQKEQHALDQERRELTAAISHDLRTPLSTIRAMIDALEDGVVTEPTDTKRYFVTIRRDIERLDRMIDDLFELAQIDAGAMRLQRRRVAVHEVVSEVVEAMRARAARSDIAIDLQVRGEAPPALIDGDRIERAISNLLRNALEHSAAGGVVRVSVDASGDHAIVEVEDTGDGIAEADLPHIWTRFYRAERSRARPSAESDGVGLGLAITKGIVELHGGTVRVRSRQGAGTSFTLQLPLTVEALEAAR